MDEKTPTPDPTPDPTPGPTRERKVVGITALVAATVAAFVIGGLGGVLVGQQTGDDDWGGYDMMGNGQRWEHMDPDGDGEFDGPRGPMWGFGHMGR